MCGIAGVLNFDIDKSVSEYSIKKMTDVLQHRGPDGEGFYINKNIGLGHRRLSIIDLESGDQPLFNEDKNIVLIFNGEIYNYLELKKVLEKCGHNFYTSSDAEVIIHAYEQWGNDFVNKLNGMWAFAIWNDKEKELFISRDRVGKKPLYFCLHNGSFLFASEIKSLLAYGLPKIANLEFLEIYLSLGYLPAPFTFYKNVKKLKAGYNIVVKDGHLKEYQYWDLPEIDENNMITDLKEVSENFESLFKNSVTLRMISDVPFGAFLSGGLDSASVVATMSEVSSRPVETFTIGFKEKEFDESLLAEDVARKFNTNHHLHLVDHDSFDESLKKIIFHYDEPFGDSSTIPTGYVSNFASKKVKMVLTGDGGDEVLSGYTTYLGEKFSSHYQILPAFIRISLPKVISSFSTSSANSRRYKLNRIQNVLEASNMSFNDRIISKASWIEKPILKLLLKNVEHRFSIEDFFSDFFSNCKYSDNFYKLMYYNLKLSLPEDMLVKVDRMSMAHSLEARSPFLDYRIIEYMVKVDKKIKLPGYNRKYILKNTIGKKLPVSLLKSPKKGFVSPIREWFKAQSFEKKLDELADSGQILDKNIIKNIIIEHKLGSKDYGNFIWMLFVLKSWLEELTYE